MPSNCKCRKCWDYGYNTHPDPPAKPGELNPWQINHQQPKITISFGGFYQVPDQTC